VKPAAAQPDPLAATDPYNAWNAVLDRLESDVATVEDQLRTGRVAVTAAWTPPQDLGPLPIHLVPRADAIVSRQSTAAQAVALAIASNRKQSTAMRRMEVGSRGRPRAAFVDRAV
jgi:hypothetical protein